jgi:DNA-binding CsgD family transcriptional regulator
MLESKIGGMNIDIHKFHESLRQFTAAHNIQEIKELTSYFVSHLGFDVFVYALRVPNQFSESRLIVTSTYPESWLTHYFEHDYSYSDPVLSHCKQHVIPVQWQDIATTATKLGTRIMSEAGDFGLRHGISVPVHCPNGELGIFSMALDHKIRSAREITTHALPYVHLLAISLHEAVRRVSELVSLDAGKNTLSEREQECLRWVADGKTSWGISLVLGISERTVNFHLKNAAIKLEVFNRQHAVVKAVLKGLIQPRPF